MSVVSLPQVTAIVCQTCTPTKSNMPACSGCPREFTTDAKNLYHLADARLSKQADVVLIAESPVLPRYLDSSIIHTPFQDDSGKIVTAALELVRTSTPAFANLKIAKTYAVLCTGLDPNRTTAEQCSAHLKASLAAACTPNKTPVLIVMGMTGVRALGIPAKSQKEVLGRILPGVEIDGRTYTVVVTISTKQAVAASGMYTTFIGDIKRAFEIAAGGLKAQESIEQLTTLYRFPKTIEEVKNVCDYIINYAPEGRDPTTWAISVDTETNTLFPHRITAKLLGVSFAWDHGQSTYIPLWHAETPYDAAEAFAHVIRVLLSKKPKIFHNAKYDLKVFRRMGAEVENFTWDTMLGEHCLEEDKKGQYGLKQLTRSVAPEFATYADVLHDLLQKLEGESQLDNIRKAEKDKETPPDPLNPQSKKKKKKEKKDGGFEKIPLKDLSLYGAVDTDMTRRICIKQLERMYLEQSKIDAQKMYLKTQRAGTRFAIPNLVASTEPIKTLVKEVPVKVSPVLGRMEYEGIRIDREYTKQLDEKLFKVISDTQTELFEMAGDSGINLNSTAMIGDLLFGQGFVHPDTKERCWYPSVSLTKTGKEQTTEKVLKFLTAKYKCPFSSKQLIYRKATKAKDTFLANVLTLSELDGFLHTNYSIHGTGTGRLSSYDMNMQNVPKKLAGLSIKKVFIPDDDSYVFVNADAKGAEIRIFTAYTGDKELIQSLRDGQDTHSFIGSKIIAMVRTETGGEAVLRSMDLDPDRPLTYEDFAARDAWKVKEPAYGEMLDKFRTAIKRVVFGILYGAGPRKIAETIGISLDQAQSIIQQLFKLYPSIEAYIKKTEWELDTFGFVETYFGRRRRFNVRGAAKYLVGRAKRQAVNFKIQSTSSDIVMGRLIAAEQPLIRDLKGRLLLTVHDSIGFQIPKKYLSHLPAFVKEVLEDGAAQACPWLPVEFKWDYEVGPSYGELKQYSDYMAANNNIQEPINVSEEAYSEEEVRTELASGLEA